MASSKATLIGVLALTVFTIFGAIKLGGMVENLSQGMVANRNHVEVATAAK